MVSLSNISALLLTPVHYGIYALFIIALFESGRLIVQWLLRLKHRGVLTNQSLVLKTGGATAYPIMSLATRQPQTSVEDLDLDAMRRLEFIRIATRITPMLGLIATLIPMGPALVALTKNDVAQMSELLRTAFSSVVLALAASCVCFWIATVRRRWCVEEVLTIKRQRETDARAIPASKIDRRAA
jgi:biopolymer transport protein ExbB/TolQ